MVRQGLPGDYDPRSVARRTPEANADSREASDSTRATGVNRRVRPAAVADYAPAMDVIRTRVSADGRPKLKVAMNCDAAESRWESGQIARGCRPVHERTSTRCT